jgi:voltage-gated potassium channel
MSMDESSSQGWRPIAVAALRGVLTASVLVTLYYLLPLERRSEASAIALLAGGALVFVGLLTWQVRAIMRSKHPAVQALAGLFAAVPLFILLFASAYYLMSQGETSNFTSKLSRTDALYFTVTIFATVGFGDISARTEPARLVVTAQMVLDLIILGLGLRIILAAVQRGRERLTELTSADSASQ